MAYTQFSLTIWADGGYPGASIRIGLYTAIASTPSPPDLTSFAEAAFPGYARGTVPPGTYLPRLADGQALVVPPTLAWSWQGTAAPPCVVVGYYGIITFGNGDTQLYGFARLPRSLAFVGPGSFMSLGIALTDSDNTVSV